MIGQRERSNGLDERGLKYDISASEEQFSSQCFFLIQNRLCTRPTSLCYKSLMALWATQFCLELLGSKARNQEQGSLKRSPSKQLHPPHTPRQVHKLQHVV